MVEQKEYTMYCTHCVCEKTRKCGPCEQLVNLGEVYSSYSAILSAFLKVWVFQHSKLEKSENLSSS